MPTPREQAMANNFRMATDTFANDWREGTFDWLKTNAADMIAEIDVAEKNLDAAWKEAIANPTSEMKFMIALGLWKGVHVKALNEFKQRTGS